MYVHVSMYVCMCYKPQAYVELVSLYDFRWRIVRIVVRLVVLIPLITGMHTVEVARFARPILIGPHERLLA
jgi:hypothetical protein